MSTMERTDPIIESLISFNQNMAKQSQKIANASRNIWLPEKRARYNAKRREKDVELVFATWNTLPKGATESVVNIADVPPKAAKKHTRAVKIHKSSLHARDSKSIELFEAINGSGDNEKAGQTMMTSSSAMLEILTKALPNYNSRVVSDVPLNFRARYDDWDVAENKGITILRYWQLYRLASFYGTNQMNQLSLDYIDQALALIPPLGKGEMPHKWEVLARVHRAMALDGLGDSAGAVREYRLCSSAIRLLASCGKVDQTDANDILIKKTNGWFQAIIRNLIKIKYDAGSSRPCFAPEERLDLMKELGFGMYAEDNLKCSSCKKTDLETKLFLCSGCKSVWYCSKVCAKDSWSRGHKETCSSGSGLDQPIKLNTSMMNHVRDGTAEPGGIAIFGSLDGRSTPMMFGKDHSTGQFYDVLFGEDVLFEEEKVGPPTRAEAEKVAYNQLLSMMNASM